MGGDIEFVEGLVGQLVVLELSPSHARRQNGALCQRLHFYEDYCPFALTDAYLLAGVSPLYCVLPLFGPAARFSGASFCYCPDPVFRYLAHSGFRECRDVHTCSHCHPGYEVLSVSPTSVFNMWRIHVPAFRYTRAVPVLPGVDRRPRKEGTAAVRPCLDPGVLARVLLQQVQGQVHRRARHVRHRRSACLQVGRPLPLFAVHGFSAV